MKKLTVIAAGLGYRLLEEHAMTEMAGLRFSAAPSVFPAVTCVAQASLRTGGLTPAEHGMLANGVWLERLRKPAFWEQSCRLVKGARVWGRSTGLFFMQQSLGEEVELIVSPAPIHCHGGGMIMSCYTQPPGMADVLVRRCGKFPLWRYWGPLASPKVGRKCISYFEAMTDAHDVDEAYLYLPTLDYTAQKYGPASDSHAAALKEFRHQLERVADLCMRRGCELEVRGDYEITPVTEEPFMPNVILRRNGLFRTRTVAARAYPDFHSSRAFAMCDHEVAVICGEARDEAVAALLATGRCVLADEPGLPAPVLVAKGGSWCAYPWWTDAREAPDFAAHVDIHNKPGFDPKELFLFNRGTVKGTHGRRCQVAVAGAGQGGVVS